MMFHIQNPNRPLPLQLELIGVDHHQEPIVRPGGMPFFQWFYCVKGQGEFIVNGQRSIISQGQGLLISSDSEGQLAGKFFTHCKCTKPASIICRFRKSSNAISGRSA